MFINSWGPFTGGEQAAEGRLAQVRRADSPLAELLPEWDSVPRVLEHLARKTDTELIEEAQEQEGAPRLWQDVGLFYQFAGRYSQAISVYRRFYERLCEQGKYDGQWLPKGIPLVRLAECHELLGHASISARYLLLTAVSDAIRDRGETQSKRRCLLQSIAARLGRCSFEGVLCGMLCELASPREPEPTRVFS